MFKFAVQRKMYEHFRDRLKLDQRLHLKTANKKKIKIAKTSEPTHSKEAKRILSADKASIFLISMKLDLCRKAFLVGKKISKSDKVIRSKINIKVLCILS